VGSRSPVAAPAADVERRVMATARAAIQVRERVLVRKKEVKSRGNMS
jgi:hypothetical protein